MGRLTHMTPTRERYHVWLDRDARKGLRVVKAREGIPEAEQIRRAVRIWLDSKGVKAKAAARCVSPRRTA